jgi:hypothetical protein
MAGRRSARIALSPFTNVSVSRKGAGNRGLAGSENGRSIATGPRSGSAEATLADSAIFIAMEPKIHARGRIDPMVAADTVPVKTRDWSRQRHRIER